MFDQISLHVLTYLTVLLWEGILMVDLLAVAGIIAIFSIFGLILTGLGRI
jgi:hypothetical protein